MKNIQIPIEDQKLLQKLGVEAVILFGSYATNTQSPDSDLDFGILLNDDGRIRRRENYHDYFTSVYDIFAGRFGDLNGLDIVFLDRAPLELRRHVALYGKTLMEKIPGRVADFSAQTMLLYADFEPYRKMLNEAVLQNI